MSSRTPGAWIAAVAVAVGWSCIAERSDHEQASVHPPLDCSEETADCNGEKADACETDILSSGENCGACGSDCSGGPCVGGVCGDPALSVARKQDGVCEMVSAGPAIFWANCGGGEIMAMPDPTRRPVELASRQGWVRGLAVDDTHVYWSRSTPGQAGIWRVARTGGTPTQLVVDDHVGGIAVDAESVFWARWVFVDDQDEEGGVHSAPKDGGPSLVLAKGPASELTIDATSVYWADPQARTLNRGEKSGSGVTVLAPTGDVSAIRVVGGTILWADNDGLFAVNDSGGGAEFIDRYSSGGIGAADGSLYYARGREIVKRALSGTESTQVAWVSEGSVGGIALVSDYLFWGNFNTNEVFRLDR